MNKTAKVYIFRDAIAVYLSTGETSYISKKDARKLAKLLNHAARDPAGFRSTEIELQKPFKD